MSTDIPSPAAFKNIVEKNKEERISKIVEETIKKITENLKKGVSEIYHPECYASKEIIAKVNKHFNPYHWEVILDACDDYLYVKPLE